MLFNSFQYWVYLPIVLIGYYLIPYRWRWTLLLVASYYFYMCWKVEYSLLLVISTAVDYYTGKYIFYANTEVKRKLGLAISLSVNLGLLFFFKYYNFLATSANTLFGEFNILGAFPSLNVLLPVGISFYTFQTMSYTLDVYQKKREPENHIGYFALYVSFFPQLVAGPIERSTRLLPELRKHVSFSTDNMVNGLRLVLWGMVKKVVVADNLAVVVNRIYNSPESYSGFPLALATIFFGFQIYCDFSGYSDIAIGSARMLGINLMKNFNRPYSAKSISEFWQRWHISLSTWFRDYVYIPLGGNRSSKMLWVRNIFITFVLSGIWHGANWTFFIWGALHGFYYLMSLATGRIRASMDIALSSHGLSKLVSIRKTVVTFVLVQISWVFFRANSLNDAFLILQRIATSFKLQSLSLGWCAGARSKFEVMLGVLLILSLEFVQRFMKDCDASIAWGRLSNVPRYITYIGMILILLIFGRINQSEFIYFQF